MAYLICVGEKMQTFHFDMGVAVKRNMNDYNKKNINLIKLLQ